MCGPGPESTILAEFTDDGEPGNAALTYAANYGGKIRHFSGGLGQQCWTKRRLQMSEPACTED
jgi:hypothetical protein